MASDKMPVRLSDDDLQAIIDEDTDYDLDMQIEALLHHIYALERDLAAAHEQYDTLKRDVALRITELEQANDKWAGRAERLRCELASVMQERDDVRRVLGEQLTGAHDALEAAGTQRLD